MEVSPHRLAINHRRIKLPPGPRRAADRRADQHRMLAKEALEPTINLRLPGQRRRIIGKCIAHRLLDIGMHIRPAILRPRPHLLAMGREHTHRAQHLKRLIAAAHIRCGFGGTGKHRRQCRHHLAEFPPHNALCRRLAEILGESQRHGRKISRQHRMKQLRPLTHAMARKTIGQRISRIITRHGAQHQAQIRHIARHRPQHRQRRKPMAAPLARHQPR